MDISTTPPIAPSILGLNYTWPKYKSTDFDRYVRCLLDADYSWYEESGAELVFEKWHKPVSENSNNLEPFQLGDNKDRLPFQAIERLAWYHLAFNDDPDKYGIHFDLRRMEEASRRCLYSLVQEKQIYPRWIPYCAFFQMVLAHEHCHAWVEDIVCFNDKAWYTNNVRNPEYRTYIMEEEALCNTIAYSWAKDFIQTTTLESRQQNDVLRCISDWMRKCPDGYKNFVEIEDFALQSNSILIDENGIDAHGADYQIGFIPLLKDRYKIPESSAKYSLPLYFNFDLSDNKSNLGKNIPRPGTPDYKDTVARNCYWRGAKVPIHWHENCS
jgi:hypothetical protein